MSNLEVWLPMTAVSDPMQALERGMYKIKARLEEGGGGGIKERPASLQTIQVVKI